MSFQDAVAALKRAAFSDAKFKRDKANPEFVQAALNDYTKAAAQLAAAINADSVQEKIKAALRKKQPAIDKRLEEIVPIAQRLGLEVRATAKDPLGAASTPAGASQAAGKSSDVPDKPRIPPAPHPVTATRDYFKESVAALKQAQLADAKYRKTKDENMCAKVTGYFSVAEELLLCATNSPKISVKIKAALSPKLDQVQKRLTQLEPKLTAAQVRELKVAADSRRSVAEAAAGTPATRPAAPTTQNIFNSSPQHDAPAPQLTGTKLSKASEGLKEPVTPPLDVSVKETIRYCKRCKAVFGGQQCPGGHPNFLYSKKVPDGVSTGDQITKQTAETSLAPASSSGVQAAANTKEAPVNGVDKAPSEEPPETPESTAALRSNALYETEGEVGKRQELHDTGDHNENGSDGSDIVDKNKDRQKQQEKQTEREVDQHEQELGHSETAPQQDEGQIETHRTHDDAVNRTDEPQLGMAVTSALKEKEASDGLQGLRLSSSSPKRFSSPLTPEAQANSTTMARTSPDDAVWQLSQQLLMAQEATRAAEDALFSERLRVRDLEHAITTEVKARESAEARVVEVKSFQEATQKDKDDGLSMFESALATERTLREKAEASTETMRQEAEVKIEEMQRKTQRQITEVREQLQSSVDDALSAQRNLNQHSEHSVSELQETLQLEHNGRVQAEQQLDTVQKLMSSVILNVTEMEQQSRSELELRVRDAVESNTAANAELLADVQTRIEAAEKRATQAEKRVKLEMESRKRLGEKAQQTSEALSKTVSALASASAELTTLRVQQMDRCSAVFTQGAAHDREEMHAMLASNNLNFELGYVFQENPLLMSEEDLMDEFWDAYSWRYKRDSDDESEGLELRQVGCQTSLPHEEQAWKVIANQLQLENDAATSSKAHMEQKLLRATSDKDVTEQECHRKEQQIEKVSRQLEDASCSLNVAEENEKKLRKEVDHGKLQIQNLTEQLLEEQHRVQMHAEDNFELQELLRDATDAKDVALRDVVAKDEQLQLYKSNPAAAEMDTKIADAEAKATAPLREELAAKTTQLIEVNARLVEMETSLKDLQKRHAVELRAAAEDESHRNASADLEEKLKLADKATATAEERAADAESNLERVIKQLQDMQEQHAETAKHLYDLHAAEAEAQHAATKQEEKAAMAAKIMVDEANCQASYVVREAEREKAEAVAQTEAITVILHQAEEHIRELTGRLHDKEQQLSVAQKKCVSIEQAREATVADAQREKEKLTAKWQQMLFATKQEAMLAIGLAIEDAESKSSAALKVETSLRAAAEHEIQALQKRIVELEHDFSALKQRTKDDLDRYKDARDDELRRAAVEAERRTQVHVEAQNHAMVSVKDACDRECANHQKILDSEIEARRVAEARALAETESKVAHEQQATQLTTKLQQAEGKHAALQSELAQAAADTGRYRKQLADAEASAQRAAAMVAQEAATAKASLVTQLQTAETKINEAEAKIADLLQAKIQVEAKLKRSESKRKRAEQQLLIAEDQLCDVQNAQGGHLGSMRQPLPQSGTTPVSRTDQVAGCETLAERSIEDVTNRESSTYSPLELALSSPARSRLDERRQRQQFRKGRIPLTTGEQIK